MNAIVQIDASLPALVRKAAQKLASAETAAEVLDARQQASVVYDAAKSAGRIARAKQAHDEILGTVYRAQADALEIESMAKRRLADEYDAAQERGEVRTRSDNQYASSKPEEAVSVSDLGLTHKDIHEARQIRDAELANPGIVRRTLDDLIECGEEPTKAAVKREIVNRTSFTGNNEWYTPSEYIEIARTFMGGFDLDPASSEIANETVNAKRFYTEADNGLEQEWTGSVWLNPPYAQPAIGEFIEKAVDEYASGRVTSMIVLTHNYTDTRWFQAGAANASAICFTRGRIRFEGPNGEKASPTQGQAFFYFGDDTAGFHQHFSPLGFVVQVMK